MMRPLLTLFVVAIVLCSMVGLRAQGGGTRGYKLQFELRDSLEGKPIARANCRVYSPEGKLLSYGISDGQGRVSISVSGGEERLVFSSLGYQTLRVEAKGYQAGECMCLGFPPERFSSER